jgi:hypothetical protein
MYMYDKYLAEIFLEWEMFQTNVAEKIKTHILCSRTFPENRAVYGIMWKKYGRAGQATGDNIIRRMRFACWIAKATDTHSEYVILIAFPRQQWLCESAWMLRYTYIAYLVMFHYRGDAPSSGLHPGSGLTSLQDKTKLNFAGPLPKHIFWLLTPII